MATPNHTHAKDCPDYKAAVADRAKRDAAALKREAHLQTIARSYWMDSYIKLK